jgi:transcription elongation factor Elf1
MATFIHRKCENKDCKSHEKLFSWSENEPLASCQIIGGGKESMTVKCETCGLEFETHRVKQKRKATYPHYNSSADAVFNSYSEQRAYEKKHNLEPI